MIDVTPSREVLTIESFGLLIQEAATAHARQEQHHRGDEITKHWNCCAYHASGRLGPEDPCDALLPADDE